MAVHTWGCCRCGDALPVSSRPRVQIPVATLLNCNAYTVEEEKNQMAKLFNMPKSPDQRYIAPEVTINGEASLQCYVGKTAIQPTEAAAMGAGSPPFPTPKQLLAGLIANNIPQSQCALLGPGVDPDCGDDNTGIETATRMVNEIYAPWYETAGLQLMKQAGVTPAVDA